MKHETATRGTSATVEVPAVGGNVEVRRIPPKLVREIRAKATKGGRFDFQELMVWQLVYGLKAPNFTQAEARAITFRFTLGTLQPIVDRIDELSGTDEHLHGVEDSVPHRLRRYAQQMVMATAWLKRFPDAPSRVARTPRARGAGRPAARRSTTPSRAGPSDDEGPSDEPPPAGRLCACGCGLDISHRAPQARYLTEAHAAFARQRRKRARARDWNPDVSRRDPYLRFDEPTYEQLRKRIEDGCRCNGHHIADPEDHHCTKCGHRRGWALPVGATVPARSAETRRARSSEVAR
jgi:hypothetical protein